VIFLYDRTILFIFGHYPFCRPLVHRDIIEYAVAFCVCAIENE
jgi:hypothetical protein